MWAVLKPGFLAFLKDPFDTNPLDIIVFDVLPASDGNGEGRVSLAKEVKDHNPLRHYFRVSVLLFCEEPIVQLFVLVFFFHFQPVRGGCDIVCTLVETTFGFMACAEVK